MDEERPDRRQADHAHLQQGGLLLEVREELTRLPVELHPGVLRPPQHAAPRRLHPGPGETAADPGEASVLFRRLYRHVTARFYAM